MVGHTSGGRISFFLSLLTQRLDLSCPKRLNRKISAFFVEIGGWLMFDNTER